ncbi:MAG: hypothetical protein UFD09_02845, partial [Prevotella sp.]|nr:hypothetical protein [Prevotella sp.]
YGLLPFQGVLLWASAFQGVLLWASAFQGVLLWASAFSGRASMGFCPFRACCYGLLPFTLLYPSASDFQFRYAPVTVGSGCAAMGYRLLPLLGVLEPDAKLAAVTQLSQM